MKTESEYKPNLPESTHVRFVRKGHKRDGLECIVLDALQNPSQRAMNQWYDVRFLDGTYMRCHERDLQPLEEARSA